MITTSASLTASATELAPCPPAATRSSMAFWLRLKPVTVKPALTRFLAIGRPMMPRPMNATFCDMSFSKILGMRVL
ncbi:hypothetical protein D3C74_484320 [compost metagenome]